MSKAGASSSLAAVPAVTAGNSSRRQRTVTGITNATTKTDPTFRSTLSKSNNSWYSGEPGEKPTTLRTGNIEKEKSRPRQAFEKSDNYTKSRNAANDGKRYSYVGDCTNAIQRDFTLRFASPSQSAKAPGAFSLLPPLKFVERVAEAKVMTAGPSHVGRSETISLRAREGRIAGVADASRFSVVVSPLPR